MSQDFDLSPFVSAGPIRFGMKPPEVAALLGPPDFTHTNILGERCEDRGPIGISYTPEANEVSEVSFTPGRNVTFEGEPIFGGSDPVEVLARRDPKPYVRYGLLVFMDLGMTLTGFHDDDPSQHSVGLFMKGKFGHVAEKFERFDLEGYRRRRLR